MSFVPPAIHVEEHAFFFPLNSFNWNIEMDLVSLLWVRYSSLGAGVVSCSSKPHELTMRKRKNQSSVTRKIEYRYPLHYFFSNIYPIGRPHLSSASYHSWRAPVCCFPLFLHTFSPYFTHLGLFFSLFIKWNSGLQLGLFRTMKYLSKECFHL
jgi:hypothetical protein